MIHSNQHILGNINANLNTRTAYYTNRNKMDKTEFAAMQASQKQLFNTWANPASSSPFEFSNLQSFAFTKNLDKEKSIAQNVLNITGASSHGGVIAAFDLETLGGFNATTFTGSLTDYEKGLSAITEFAVHKKIIGAGGKGSETLRSNYSFGIESSQHQYFEQLFIKAETMGMGNLSATEKSTLERLARYSDNSSFIYKNGVYELNQLGASVIDLNASKMGYSNLRRVGEHQGFGTELGRSLYAKAVGTLNAANVVTGYNINVFDLPVLNEMSSRFGLKPLDLKDNQVYDVMQTFRNAFQGLGHQEVQNIASRYGVKDFNPARPGSLEALADAMGLKLNAHLASSDVDATMEVGLFQRAFGNKQTLPEFMLGRVEQLSSIKSNTVVNQNNFNNRVFYANKSIMASNQSVDFFSIDGKLQQNEWIVNRGEYYKMNSMNFVSKEDLIKRTDVQTANRILTNNNATDGVYEMVLQGASKYNNGKQVHMYRSSTEEFEDYFRSHLTLSNKVRSNQSVTSIYDVTQGMIDRKTLKAQQDKARREFLSYVDGSGSKSYENMQQMYTAYNKMEQAFKAQGLDVNAKNVRSMLDGTLTGVSKADIFSHFNYVSPQRYTMFENMLGLMKSSNQTMQQVFNTINSSITEDLVRSSIPNEVTGITSKMVESARQMAFTNFMSNYAFDYNIGKMDESQARKLFLPMFDNTGKLMGDMTSIDFSSVTAGTNGIQKLVSGIDKHAPGSMQHARQVSALRYVSEQLEKGGLLSKGFTSTIGSNAQVYGVAQNMSKQIHDNMNFIMGGSGVGVVKQIASNKPLNAILSSLDAGDYSHLTDEQRDFAYGYLRNVTDNAPGEFSTKSVKVMLKDPAKQTKRLLNSAGIDAYNKRNSLNVADMVTNAVTGSLQSHAVQVRGRNSMGGLGELLQSKYHYTEQNVDTLKGILYNNRGLVSKYNMDVKIFDQGGQLFMSAVDQSKGQRMARMIDSGASIDELKKIGLVTALPTISTETGVRTVKTGRVHKGITKNLNVYVNKASVESNKSLGQAMRVQQEDIVDQSLKSWYMVSDRAMERYSNGDLDVANRIVNRAAGKPIHEAAALTGLQTIYTPTGMKTTTIANKNDLLLNDHINYRGLYDMLPFLYDVDEEIREDINNIFAKQDRISSNQVAGQIGKWQEELMNGQLRSSKSIDNIALEEYMMKNLVNNRNIVSKLIQHGQGVFDDKTMDALKWFVGSPLTQVLAEGKTQDWYASHKSPIAHVPFGAISDTSRANQNASLNYVSYDKGRIDDNYANYLKRFNITLGKEVMTKEDLQNYSEFVQRTGGRFNQYGSHVTGSVKMMSTHEAFGALDNLDTKDVMTSLKTQGLRYSQQDLDTAMSVLRFNVNTHEQRLLVNPVLNPIVSAPELVGYKMDGLTENQVADFFNANNGMKLKPNQRFTVGGQEFRYDKSIAGSITGYDGNTIFVNPAYRQMDSIKMSVGHLEKGMGSVLDFGSDDRNKRMLPLVSEIWERAFGKTAAIANFEMGKHEATGLISGRYIFEAANSVAGDSVLESKMTSLFKKHLPGWGGEFTDVDGVRSFVIAGMPENATGNVKGISNFINELSTLAQDDEGYNKMYSNIKSMFEKDEFRGTIARTVNSELDPINEGKIQMRVKQQFGSERVQGFSYLQGKKYRRWASTLNDFEDSLLKQTSKYQEGMGYVRGMRGAVQGAMGTEVNPVKAISFDSMAVPRGGISAEDMTKSFFDVIGQDSKFADQDYLKIDLGNVSVTNPFTKQKENFIYLPKITTHEVDGIVHLSPSQKKAADLLTAVEVLKSQSDNVTYTAANRKVNDAYAGLFASFYDEYNHKDGIVNQMVLQGRVPLTARVLGESITPPVLKGMVGVDEATARDVVNQAVNQIRETGDLSGLDFYDNETFSRSLREHNGKTMFYDTGYTSRHVLEGMNVDFKVIGRQIATGESVMNEQESSLLNRALRSQGLMNDAGEIVTGFDESSFTAPTPTRKQIQKQYRKVISQEIEKVAMTKVNQQIPKAEMAEIITRANEIAKEQAQNKLNKQHAIKLKREKQKALNAAYESIGATYAKEIGFAGADLRDPAFLTTSKNAMRIYLDERIQGNSVRVSSVTGIKLNQDTDGDKTLINLYLNKSEDGKFKLFNRKNDVMTAYDNLMDAQAQTNTEKWMIKALEGQILGVDKTLRRGVEEAVGDEQIRFMNALEKSVGSIAGELKDNLFFNQQTVMRAIKNRQNKTAIGYLSNPNYVIRDAAKTVFNGVGMEADADNILHFTNITEQKLIDVKHIRGDGVNEVTPVMMYGKGITKLRNATTDDEMIEGMSYIVDSFRGPIFRNGLIKDDEVGVLASNIVKGVRSNFAMTGDEYKDFQALEDSLFSVVKLFKNDEAIKIMTDPFVKNGIWKDDNIKIRNLASGVQAESELLNAKSALLSNSGDKLRMTLGINGDTQLGHNGSRYQAGAYQMGEYKVENNMHSVNLISSNGDNFKVYGINEDDLINQMQRDFKVYNGVSVDDVQKVSMQSFSDNYVNEALGGYNAFATRKIESDLAYQVTMNDLSSRDMRSYVSSRVANYTSGDVNDATDFIMSSFAGRNADEMIELAILNQSYFSSPIGKQVEDFARSTEYMVGNNLASREQVGGMIKHFNNELRQKGMDAATARANAMRYGANKDLVLTNGQISHIMSESATTSAFNSANISPASQNMYNINTTSAYVGGIADTLVEEYSHKTELPVEQIRGLVNEHITDASMQDVIATNKAALGRTESLIDSAYASQGAGALGWSSHRTGFSIDSLTTNSQLESFIDSMNSAVIGRGQYAGLSIGDLSLNDLTSIMDDTTLVGDTSAVGIGTLDHVRATLQATEKLSSVDDSNAMLSAIRNRSNYVVGELSNIDISVSQLNEGIRQAATNRPRVSAATSGFDALNGMSGKTKGLIAAGVGVAALAASTVSGMQFTASQKLGKPVESGSYESDGTNTKTASVSHLAPASKGTYLQPNTKYRISAKNPNGVNNSSINMMAHRTTGASNMRVVNTDNRDQISKQWIEQQVIENF